MGAPPATPKRDPRSFIEEICTRVSDGETLNEVCADLKDYGGPSHSAFRRWVMADDELAKQYARAKELQADYLVEEMVEIADDGSNDYMTIVKGDMEYNVEDREVTSRSKLRVDTRKWIAAKLAPKKYSDKMDVTSGGEKLTAPIIIEWNGSNSDKADS